MSAREQGAAKPDELRCRYDDCAEGHPVPQDDNADVTCPTCRETLGLPYIHPTARARSLPQGAARHYRVHANAPTLDVETVVKALASEWPLSHTQRDGTAQRLVLSRVAEALGIKAEYSAAVEARKMEGHQP